MAERAAEPGGHAPPPGPFVDAPHRLAGLGDLRLESGEAIRDFQQSYVTHGELAPDGGNAVLVCSAISGNHHRLDFLLGDEGALSPRRWFVIATDPIGNGLSTSSGNSVLQPGMAFPRFTIRDMVEAQRRLVSEHLGIERLAAVVGASMGGMQALQWAVSAPEMVGAVVAMTPMARTHPWSVAVNEATRRCLMADPAWTGQGFSGRPARGWHAWVIALQVLAGRTPQGLAQGLSQSFAGPAEVVAWLDERVAAWEAAGFDPHDWLYQSWAYDAHDLGTSPGFGGDTDRALSAIGAPVLVLAPPLDLYNPVEAARAIAERIPGARYREIPSVQGHQAASALSADDVAFIDAAVRDFLRSQVSGPD